MTHSVKKESPKPRLPYEKPRIESSTVFERQALTSCPTGRPADSPNGPPSKRCAMNS